jgi:membrane protease YdiL (CAAX protease family)
MSIMSNLKSFITKRPVLATISITIIWFLLIMISTGVATGLFKKEFGDSTTSFIGHLVGIIFVLTLLWRLGWLKYAGISQLGTYQIWLIAIIGTVYFALASLFSFYGKLSFDFSNLTDLSFSGNVIKLNIAVSIDEEFLFRGDILYILIRSWGDSLNGKIGSVILISGIFALFHILNVLFWGTSLISILFLVLETFIISIWWASMVLKGGSIWPTFLAHFVINTAVTLQGHTQSITQPEFQAYLKLLLFSLPLGIYGFWMIFRIPNQQKKSIDRFVST